MREMDIQPFPRPNTFTDLDQTFRTRLSQTTVMWPQQAIRLLTYMAHPNDPAGRVFLSEILEGWTSDSPVVPHRLRQMQREWLRLTDVLNLHDLHAGEHQANRGGVSLSKSVALAAGSIQDCGSSEAKLWSIWAQQKDVAHLVAAATIVAAEARARAKLKPFGQFGMGFSQLQPFPLAMMLPDLVLSLALYLQEYGLAQVPHGREQPMLDPDTLWRIPSNLNVMPIAPPIRKINRNALLLLEGRRAGNRGKWLRTG